MVQRTRNGHHFIVCFNFGSSGCRLRLPYWHSESLARNAVTVLPSSKHEFDTQLCKRFRIFRVRLEKALTW